MNLPPHQWRSDGGYQPHEAATPYYLYPTYPAAPHPISYIPGPVPVHAIVTHPPPPQPPVLPRPQPPLPVPIPRPAHPSSSSSACLLRPGMNYLFPRKHTVLHIFNKASKIWEPKYRGAKLGFKIFKVSTRLRVVDVIVHVLGSGGSGGGGNDGNQNSGRGDKDRKKDNNNDNIDEEEAKKWAVTEVTEQGDGTWVKGATVRFASEKGRLALEAIGWTEKRGKGLPPVWVVVHRV